MHAKLLHFLLESLHDSLVWDFAGIIFSMWNAFEF